ncbi:unnamed protein product [Sphagnum tenellum]
MLGCVQLNAQQDAFWLNYKRALRSDRISEAVTIPIIRGILKFYTGAPTMLVEEYKRLSCKQYLPRVLEEQKAVMQQHNDKLDYDVLH